jgi:hypothetical protein
MNLLLSQKSTIDFKHFNRPLLKRLSQRWKALRLRRKGPQWAGVALLVLVGDILIATAVWIAVDFVLR